MLFQTHPHKRINPVLKRRVGHICQTLAIVILPWLGLTVASMAAPGLIDNVTAEAMTTNFNLGMAAFEKQNWPKAVANLEKAISLVENYPDKEASAAAKQRMSAAYYMVGAAAFNLPDFPKAIATFGRFITMFPKDDKVPSARLSVARATYLNGDFGKAAKLFAELEQYPSLREQALIIQSQCLKESGKITELVVVVEKLIADGITTSGRANAALMLAQARANAREFDKLAPLLDQLVTCRHLVENVIELNALIVALGDAQMAQDQFEEASRTYLKVLPPAQVIAFQNQRIEMLSRRIAANKAADKNNPQMTLTLMGQTAEFQSVLDQAKVLLADFEKLSDYMPGLMLRNARCWYGRDRKWESILMNERLMDLYPDAEKEREAALFSNVICYADLLQVKTCQQLCEQYFKEFPKGENVETVAYVQGAVAIQSGDMKGAASIFNQTVEFYPNSPFIDQMYLLLGSARMSLGELNEAARIYQRYIEKYPKGSGVEEAEYRLAVIPVYRGRYEEGWKLLEAFLKKYPTSPFVEDAEYRLMVCKYAASQYDKVLADVTTWRLRHSGGMEPEVLALKGDCLAAKLKYQEAATAYREAAESATGDEVLNYGLNEASKMLQKCGDMAQLSQMWEEFIRQRPDHFSVVVGIYWICKAKTREGKLEEAKEITANQLKLSLNNHKNEAVEMLLQQLAQLCWKRPRGTIPRPEVVLAAASPPSPAAANAVEVEPARNADPQRVAATPPPWDAMAELEKYLEPLNAIADESGRPRLAYTRMELLKLLKRPEQATEMMGTIAASRPEVLSPQLLALSGEFLQSRKQDDEAAVRYNFLKENYLRSAWLDYAYSGLGAMELAKGNAGKAVDLYKQAVEKYAGAKIKDSTFGLAMALLEFRRHEEARKLFEQVAGTREWRGELTAQAVYYLGVVEEQQGRLAEAVAYYQRVFVAYQKYSTWVGKAYLKAARCFEKLDRRKEAIAHLQEALRNDKLGVDVKSEARGILLEWGVNA